MPKSFFYLVNTVFKISTHHPLRAALSHFTCQFSFLLLITNCSFRLNKYQQSWRTVGIKIICLLRNDVIFVSKSESFLLIFVVNTINQRRIHINSCCCSSIKSWFHHQPSHSHFKFKLTISKHNAGKPEGFYRTRCVHLLCICYTGLQMCIYTF